jgi:hypothetical protein
MKKLLTIVAFLTIVATPAFAQNDLGMRATGTHSDWGTGAPSTPLYYGADGKLHYGMVDPQVTGRSTSYAAARDAVGSGRGVDAFAQVGRSRGFVGFDGSESGTVLSPSSPDYEPDYNSH